MYRGRRTRERNKTIKDALITQIKKSKISESEVSEWLWEDFGKRVKPEWKKLRKAILSDDDITPQDIAVFMIEEGVFPEEGAWDAMPARRLRSCPENTGDDKTN